MTDLTSKTVEDLRETVWTCGGGHDAFDEVVRRLEEAQQKIVAQQATIENSKKRVCAWINGGPLDFDILMFQKDEQVLAAHDAEVAAKALEEAAQVCKSGHAFWDRFDCADAIRAKAGRKE